jgi:hypothetical protein
MDEALINTIFSAPAKQAWEAIFNYLWQTFSESIPMECADAVSIDRDRAIAVLDNILSGSSWELWQQFEQTAPRTSQELKQFWLDRPDSKAILILDALSLRESAWIIEQATKRGFKIHQAKVSAAEIPADTTHFAKALGFGQRSNLEHNLMNSSCFPNVWTESTDLPFADCSTLIKADPNIIFWHHWPDCQMHDLSDSGDGYRKLAKAAAQQLCSDDFWLFIERLTQGRRLIITADHGYAHSGLFPDINQKDQADYLKKHFKQGRFTAVNAETDKPYWIPPLTQTIVSEHGAFNVVLGRKKWKSQGGYPTLTHSGLSLLEMVVPFIELSK